MYIALSGKRGFQNNSQNLSARFGDVQWRLRRGPKMKEEDENRLGIAHLHLRRVRDLGEDDPALWCKQ